MRTNTVSPLIVSIAVTKLFGRRNYELSVPVVDGSPSRMMLLHGDNGSGKTTLLKLVWNALSAADNRGHRSFLAKTPFESLTIEMSGERTLCVQKNNGLVGSFSLTLKQPGVPNMVTEYEADADLSVRSGDPRYAEFRFEDVYRRASVLAGDKDRARFRRLSATREISREAAAGYLKFLSEEVANPLYLADDRSLYSDDEDIHRTRELVSRGQGSDSNSDDRLSKLVFIELQVTMRRVNDYLRSLTIGGQNDGSANSNSIYANVLKQLATTTAYAATDEVSQEPASTLLEEITAIAPSYEEFGLVPRFDSAEFSRLFQSIQDTERRDLADRVVSPFLSSMKARYEALREAHLLLRALVPTINSFLREKELTFSPREGLRIVAMGGDRLAVESLSSGERQLLMLLCTTLLARSDTRIFIIDEPELSLGVEWQRKILDALLGLTENSNVQFLVATHSIEIISGHPGALVRLAE